MQKEKKTKKSIFAWALGLSGAGLLALTQGSGLEKVVVEQVIEAIRHGDLPRVLSYAGICFLIWIELRGVKKELKEVNTTVRSGFFQGEMRFEKIEIFQQNLEHRLTVLEQKGSH